MQHLAARAVELHQSGKLAQAEKLYREFLSAEPNHAVALHLLGVCLFQRGKAEDALVFFERSVRLQPKDPGAHINHALALSALNRIDEAKAASERAVAANPDYPGAQNSLGAALYRLGDHAGAQDCFARAVALKPDYAEALANLGLCVTQNGHLEQAIALLKKAEALNPAAPATLSGLGNAQALADDLTGASATFAKLVKLDPKNGYARAHLHHLNRRLAAWDRFDAEVKALAATGTEWSTERDLPSPLIVMTALDQPKLQLDVAKLHAATFDVGAPAIPATALPAHRTDPARRIRLGYLSPDFRQHPVATLTADLLATHDRSAFEVFAFSYGPDDGSKLRRRIESAVDRFVDLRACSTEAAAAAIRDSEIDILIDLAGYTTHSRPGIVARRPAPIQAQYLGYLGSMGARFIDYVIADAVVAPPASAALFSEAIVRLPASLQVNPLRPELPASRDDRLAHGLPAEAMVFCCFNNTFKITPGMFDVWMRIMKRAEGSVLWLFAEHEIARANLAREAAKRGIDPARLVFAGRASYEDHLARHTHADLFLDTLPYGAGTTASDALWAGLPILTTPGRSFASRMGASLAEGLGMPEMIVPDLQAYEARAIRLAKDADSLSALKEKLRAQRVTARLFDLERTRMSIEDAYRQMMALWRAGEAPRAIAVS